MDIGIYPMLRRMTPIRLWVFSVALAILITEAVVSAMDQLLNGEISPDHLLTGLAASLVAASLVVALLNSLFGALCKSEERAKLAIDASRLALWDYDVATGRVYLSEGWSRLLGGELQPTTTTLQELAELVPEEERRKAKSVILEAMKGHASSSYQLVHRVRKHNGEYIWILSQGHVTERDANGWALRMTGTNRDITKNKRMGDKLRESEAALQALLDNSPYLTWLKDTDGHYLKVNKYYADYVRLEDPAQVIGKTDFDLWPKELAELYRAEDAVVMSTRRPKSTERPSLDGDRLHWVETFKTPIIDGKGNALGTAGFARDITDRKLAEQALKQQKNFVRKIIDTVPNMISVKDPEGKFLLVNQAMAAMHGKTPEEMIGQSCAEQFQSSEYFAPIWQAYREVLDTLCKVELVTRDFRNDRECWLHITKVPMLQPDGTVQVLSVGIDITEKKIAEQQLRELAGHLLTVREEEKAHIAREIHDELGGTLTALKIEVDCLERAVAGGGNASMLERIEAMSQLLDSAASATRRVVTELHPTILDDLGLRAAFEWYGAWFQERTGIECRVSCAPCDGCQPRLTKTRDIQLFRIFQESLTNAARHSGASRVEVQMHCGSEVILMIRDNGRGLPEGRQIMATSFGMRGMAERAKQLGGKIKFDSPPSGGLEVTVKLPAYNSNGCVA